MGCQHLPETQENYESLDESLTHIGKILKLQPENNVPKTF
jgi:hypothetical protein